MTSYSLMNQCITINKFLLLAMVKILTISRAGWKIAARINKWTNTAKYDG